MSSLKSSLDPLTHQLSPLFSAILLTIVAASVVAALNDFRDSPLLASFLASKAENAEEAQPEAEKPKDCWLNRVLSCFSVKRNFASLVGRNDSGEEEITCLHGLKALSILLLFVSFKLIPMGRVPYSNRNKLTEFFNSPLSVFLRSSFLYEDVFLVVSGVLASISVMKDITSDSKKLWLKKMLARFLRLMLPLSVVLLFYAFIWEHLGTGPQWSSVVDKNADLCKESMWKNLLFIQNFYPIEDMVSPPQADQMKTSTFSVSLPSAPPTPTTWPSISNCSC